MEVAAVVGIVATFGVYLVERLLASKRVEVKLAYELEAHKQATKAELQGWQDKVDALNTRLNKMELRGR